MNTSANALLGGMAMDIGMSYAKEQHTIIHPHPPFSPDANPKKKRRVNAKVPKATLQKSQAQQNLGPPMLSGYGDTIVVSNPFDDTPPKTCLNMNMNVGSKLVGQHVLACSTNCPIVRRTTPMASMANVRGPAMAHNMGNVRPTINRTNNTSNFTSANRMPANFTSSSNNIRQNLSSGPPVMKNQMQMGQNTNFQRPSMGNQMNCNNHMNNGPININNPNGQTRPNQSFNDSSHFNNANSHRCQQTASRNCNDVRNVEKLMNTNMIISQQTQMPMSGNNPTAPRMPNQKSQAPTVNRPIKQNAAARHPNLRRALNMPPKARATGKIYPADQPVIFNCQHPHAPPIYPCGICHKEVNDNDQGLICESGCNFWFHRTCLGLSAAAFKLLTQEIYAEWACDNCLRTKNIPAVKFKP